METNLTPKVTKIAGTPKEGSWSQVFWQEPQNDEAKSLRGSLAAVVEVEAREELESASLGREVFGILEKEYLNSTQGDVLEALEKSLKQANDHLYSVLTHFSQEDLQEHPKYGILAASLWGKVLYLAGVGGANAYLVRDGKIQPVLKIVKAANVEVFDESKVHTASGFVREGDVLVLASSGFQNAVPNEEILGLISQSLQIDEVTDSLAPKIKSLEDSSKIAVLFLKVILSQTPETEEEEIALNQSLEEKKIEPRLEKIEDFLPKPQLENEPKITETDFIQGETGATLASQNQGTKKMPSFHFGKILSIVSKISSKVPGNRSFYARDWGEVRQKRKKIVVALLAILFFILAGSIAFNLRERSISSQREQFELAMSSASEKYEEAKAIMQMDKAEARKLYQEAKGYVTEAKKYNLDKEKVTNLEKVIDLGYEESLDVFKVNLEVFMDLSLAKEGFSGQSLAYQNSRVLVWDKNSKSVVKLEIPSKSAEVVAGGDELSKVNQVALWEDSGFLVSEDDGIWKVDLAKKTKSKIIEKDSEWGSILEAGSFLGNIYLLDKGEGKIWKYAPIEIGYSDKANYLKVDYELGNASSWTIDGSIWILSSDGSVLQFNHGERLDFSLSGLDEKLSLKSKIFTESEAENLYIFDPDPKKLFVFNKEGKYQSQYKLEGNGEISEFIVSEKDKIALFLSGKNLYNLELK